MGSNLAVDYVDQPEEIVMLKFDANGKRLLVDINDDGKLSIEIGDQHPNSTFRFAGDSQSIELSPEQTAKFGNWAKV